MEPSRTRLSMQGTSCTSSSRTGILTSKRMELDFNEFYNTTEQFCIDILADQALLDELKAEKYDIAITEFIDYCTPGIFEAIGVKAKIFTEATPMLPFLTNSWGIPSFDSYTPNILADQALLDELKAEKYDIAITEFIDYCTPGIFEAIGVKAKIFTEATPMLPFLTNSWGIPSFDSYTPNPTKAPMSTPQLSYFERARNVFQSYFFKFMSGRILNKMTSRFRTRFGDDFPDIRQIIQNVSFAFVNSLDAIELPRPITSKIINIGGINNRSPAKEMPYDMKQIFNMAEKGVVLFSLGSIVNTTLMPEAQKWAFIRAFEYFPDYNFVWKVDKEDPMYRMWKNFSNVYPITWVDQTTFLAQPQLKLFMSHCGQNSLTEAAYSGTPVLSIPIFADQQYNAAMVRRLGIGEILEFNKITVEVLVDAIERMLTYNRYQRKADQLRKKLLTHPRGDPKELVVKYVEYAAANPDLTNLNLLSTNMDFITLHCLDVIVPALIILALVCYAVVRVCIWILVKWFFYLRRKHKSGGRGIQLEQMKTPYKLPYELQFLLLISSAAMIHIILGSDQVVLQHRKRTSSRGRMLWRIVP
uniref:glucuronosyltransferase n=1 Tax=Steinernema glaseri TaxID=37863 RepID=A0A1I8A407_9BILA